MFEHIQLEIIETIKEYDTIIIHRHQRPDPDAIGSQCGLKLMIEASFPGKKVLVTGSSPGSLRFLASMDKVTDQDYQGALVIVTDTANAARIDDDRYSLAQKRIKIDHHPDNPDGDYAELSWVNDEASSCSEMIAELWYRHQNQLTMTDESARLLYAGMVGDTNRFLYESTSPQTMRLAAELMTFSFDHTVVNDEMNRLNKKEAKLIAYALNELRILDSGTAYLVLTQDKMEELDIEDEHTQAIVPLPRQIEGVVNWGIFVQQKTGEFRCRLRSKDPAVNQIASEHHGGGHRMAAGANAKDLDEVELIIQKLSDLAENYKK